MFDKAYFDGIWPDGVHRHDYVESLANSLIQKYGKCRMLDIGTGCGFLVKTLREKGCDAWGLEISDYAVQNCCAPGYVLKGSAVDLPFKGGSFDVVHSNGLWEYLTEEEVDRAAKEVWRVGKQQEHNIDHDGTIWQPEYQYVTWKPMEWWDKKLEKPHTTKKEITKKWKDSNRDRVNETQKAWFTAHPSYKRKRRDARLEELNKLKDKPCVDCGGRFPPIAMDFDHVKGEKYLSISRMVLRNESSWEQILSEIEKCELVCANCHRVRTSIRGDSTPQKYKKTIPNSSPRKDSFKKVLVTCPVFDGKEYCWQRWIDMAKNLTYPNYDIFVVDNSKTEDFYNKYKSQIPMVHLTFGPGEKDDGMYRVCKSMAEVQRHFLKETIPTG